MCFRGERTELLERAIVYGGAARVTCQSVDVAIAEPYEFDLPLLEKAE